MSESPYKDKLVDYLVGLKARQDRGALAALRTGLGKRPGQAPRMFPHVGPFLSSSDPGRSSVVAAFLTASLFAMHPEQTRDNSLGLAVWHATKRDNNPNGKHGEAGVESRFVAMLDASEEDLPRHLEGLISLCESAGAGLDWYRFRLDVVDLVGDDDDRRDKVRLKWAKDFWQGGSRLPAMHSAEGMENDRKDR